MSVVSLPLCSTFTVHLHIKYEDQIVVSILTIILPLSFTCKSFLTFIEIHIHPKTMRKLSPFSKTRVSAFSIHEAGLIPPSNTKGRTSLDEKEPPASPGPTTGESQSKLRVGILFGGHLNNGRHRPKPKFVITKSKYFSKNSIKDFDRK